MSGIVVFKPLGFRFLPRIGNLRIIRRTLRGRLTRRTIELSTQESPFEQ
jgi:hypothetical protein